MELSKNFNVKVYTGQPNRGHSPETIAEMCVDRLIYISDEAHPAIREQARQHRERMRSTILQYIRQAVQADRTTVCNAIKDAGQPALAEHVRSL